MRPESAKSIFILYLYRIIKSGGFPCAPCDHDDDHDDDHTRDTYRHAMPTANKATVTGFSIVEGEKSVFSIHLLYIRTHRRSIYSQVLAAARARPLIYRVYLYPILPSVGAWGRGAAYWAAFESTYDTCTFSVLAYMKYVVSWVETSRAFRLLVFCSADLTVMQELRSILPCGVSYSDCVKVSITGTATAGAAWAAAGMICTCTAVVAGKKYEPNWPAL